MKYAIFAVLLFLALTGCTGQKVQRGDTVLLTYTGRYTNQTIFDTNDKQYIDQFPNRNFQPLTVKVGSGQVIPGFDLALVDMEKGEQKTVTIKAVDAYGGYDADKTIDIPKKILSPIELTFKRDVAVPISKLPANMQNKSAIGKNITTANFAYEIRSFNETDAMLYLSAISSDVVQLEQFPWNSTLIKTTPKDLVFRHNIVEGSLIRLPQGDYFLSKNSTHAILDTTVKIGNQYQRGNEFGKVTKETKDSFIIDFNHPLAGENLVFDIRVDEIVEAN